MFCWAKSTKETKIRAQPGFIGSLIFRGPLINPPGSLGGAGPYLVKRGRVDMLGQIYLGPTQCRQQFLELFGDRSEGLRTSERSSTKM